MKQRLLQIIRDPMWQLVGVVIAVIALVVPSVSRSYRELTYDIISSTPLFSINEEAQGKVEVFFDGKPVTDAYLVIVKLSNTGNEPIVSSDYESPIQIIFNEETSILSAEIINDTEYSITTTLQVMQNRIKLDPMLINPDETVTLKIITSNYKEFNISARIVKINKIDYKSPSKDNQRLVWISVVVSTVGTYIIWGIRVYYKNKTPTILRHLDNFLVILLVISLIIAFILKK